MHITRSNKYTAVLSSDAQAWAHFDTVTECRRWAEEYGDTADRCEILNRNGLTVALHCRDSGANGRRWYKGRA